MLRSPDGAVQVLDGVTGLLVGVDTTALRHTVDVEVPVGSTLFAYTDGLIEHPGAGLDEGIAELRGRLAAAPSDADPALLCDAAVGSTVVDGRDDVALLAVRFC